MRHLLLLSLLLFGLFRIPASSADTSLPPADDRLQKNVEFWLRIYTEYDTSQGVIHDAKYIDHVYQVVDLRHGGQSAVHRAKRHWQSVLLSLQSKSHEMGQGKVVDLTPDEKKAYDLFSDVSDPDKFLTASHRKRLRFQAGQRNRFIEGLRMSGAYLPYMEQIFRERGLPPELTRLPFVESGFNVHARSKVGASGIWQFMRSTGKLFLRIDSAVDERNDPIRSTEAAARLLKINFDSLGDWGLAVTAYNHGRLGMMRAVRQVGSSHIGDLVGTYRSKNFGFASSNFFACLLAVIEAEKHSERYFGKIERDPERRFFEVTLPTSIRLRELVRFMKLDATQLHVLNPALAEEALRGQIRVPKGYRLRLPEDPGAAKLGPGAQERIFLAGYSEIPSVYKH